MDMEEIAKREAVRQKILDNAELRLNKVLGKSGATSPDSDEQKNGVKRKTVSNRRDSSPVKYDPPVFAMSTVASADLPWYEAKSEWLLVALGVFLRLLVIFFQSINIGLWFLILDTAGQFLRTKKPSPYPEHCFFIDVCLSFALPLKLVVAFGRIADFVGAVFADCCFMFTGFLLTHLFLLCLQ
ncbi:hypothetical protein TTRE_0000167501 [Trichuris trichiura]|uniref:Uncharacterized protein n=1 Tax=Trichuris trichiura TaxID=36087 RepID=A0A077Z3V1_TRITR|nr:hypothetical protein TTRE_0000167501 [Trichuris trichiura]